MQVNEDINFMRKMYFFIHYFGKYKTNQNHVNDMIEAKKNLKSMLIIALDKAREEEIDYQDWIRWHAAIIENWICSFHLDMENDMDKILSENLTAIQKLVEEIEFKKINPACQSSVQFKTAFDEYRHAINIVKNTTNPKRKLIENITERFISLIGSILLSKNNFLYNELNHQFEQDYLFIKNYLAEHFPQSSFAARIETEWGSFKEESQSIFKTEEELQNLQAERIKKTLEQINIEQEMTLLEQIYKQIGDFYNQIKQSLTDIKNKAFELSKLLTNPIAHPVQTAQNLLYAITHPMDSMKEALSWVRDNPWKTVGISLGVIVGAAVIGLGVGMIGTAIAAKSFTIATLASITTADIVIASFVGGGIGLTAVVSAIAAAGGKAAKEVALHSKQKISEELGKRLNYIQEKDEERKVAQAAIRDLQRQNQEKIRQSELYSITSVAADNVSLSDADQIINEINDLEKNALELEFCKQDVTRNIIHLDHKHNELRAEIAQDNTTSSRLASEQQIKVAYARNRFFKGNLEQDIAKSPILDNETKLEYERKANQWISTLAAKQDFNNIARLSKALASHAYTEVGDIVEELESKQRTDFIVNSFLY